MKPRKQRPSLPNFGQNGSTHQRAAEHHYCSSNLITTHNPERRDTMTNTLSTIIRELRALTPSYPLADFQAKSITERQAVKFLELLDIQKAPVDVSLIAELPRVEVVVRTTRQLGGLSGL